MLDEGEGWGHISLLGMISDSEGSWFEASLSIQVANFYGNALVVFKCACRLISRRLAHGSFVMICYDA